MAQMHIGQSPGYKQKPHLFGYSSDMPEQVSKLPQIKATMRKNSQGLKSGMSRLELMRNNYEKKLLREKEQKLNEIRTQNMERMRSGGTVREFFAERRAMEATAKERKNTTALPPIDLHFKKMKEQKHRESSPGETLPQAHLNRTNSQRVQPVSYKSEAQNTYSIPQPQNIHGRYSHPQKRTVGIDKQNPLPPLHKGMTNANQPPTPNKRYKTYANLENNDKPVHIPQAPVKRKQHVGRVRKQVPQTFIASEIASDVSDDTSDFRQDESPIPNLSKVRALREKRLSQQKLNAATTCNNNTKLTDFQKWQMDQDKARQERLDKYTRENPSENGGDLDSVVNDDLAQREKELLERINAEKNRLQAIQKQREELDKQERLEKEEEERWEQKNIQLNTQRNNVNPYSDEEELQERFVPPRLKKASITQKQKRKVSLPKYSPEEKEAELETVPGPSSEFYEQEAMKAPGPQDVTLELEPCAICGRKFATERLSKHEKACEQSSKKRKLFDTRKQRALGKEHEEYLLSGKHKQEPKKKVKKVNWRAQHNDFIATIRYAKGASDEPPPPAENPDYEKCPYCERKFNAAAAERHIPRCKDIKPRNNAPKKKR